MVTICFCFFSYTVAYSIPWPIETHIINYHRLQVQYKILVNYHSWAWECFLKVMLKKIDFFFLWSNIFLMFSNHFDMLISKIIFKNKKILLTYFSEWKTLWKATTTTLPIPSLKPFQEFIERGQALIPFLGDAGNQLQMLL